MLTAVMIALALAPSLLVLPSVLAVITPGPRTEPEVIVDPERELAPVG